MDLTLRRLGALPPGSSLPPAAPSGVVSLSPTSGLSVISGRRKLSSAAPPSLAGRTPGGVAAYDPAAGVVYCALGGEDEGRVGVLDDGGGGMGGGGVRVVECFKGLDEKGEKGERAEGRPVAVVGLAAVEMEGREEEGRGDLVVVLNKKGCVALLRGKVRGKGDGEAREEDGTAGASVEVFRGVAKLVFSEVLGVDVGVPGYVSVLGKLGKRLGIHVLRIDTNDDGGAVEAELFDVSWCPTRPKAGATALGFTVTHHGAWVLYDVGTLHFFRPDVENVEGIDQWRGQKVHGAKKLVDGAEKVAGGAKKERPLRKPLNLCKLKFQANLLPRAGRQTEGTDSSAAPLCSGGVASLGGDFVVVGYGRVVSVWDSVYGTGHGFVEMTEEIAGVGRGAADGECVVLLSNGEVFSVTMGTGDVSERVTLGAAIKRQSACMPVVKDVGWVGVKSSRLHAQPVAMSAFRAAAEAGGESVAQLLSSRIKMEESQDLSRLKLALDPSVEADKLREAFGIYVFGNLTERLEREAPASERKSAHAKGKPLLNRLPSERLSATVVGRCLREIDVGRTEFLVPLIDMVSTGVVSSDMVMAVMAGQEVGGEGPGPTSVSAALTKTMETSYGLESVLMRMSDLSELDIVRAAQFAVRSKEQALREISERTEFWKEGDISLCAKDLKQARAQAKRERKIERKKQKGDMEIDSNAGKGMNPNHQSPQQQVSDKKARFDARRAERRASIIDAEEKIFEAEEKLCRMDRVLARCFYSTMDASRFGVALRRIPPHDVYGLLRYCNTILSDYEAASGAAQVVGKGKRRQSRKPVGLGMKSKPVEDSDSAMVDVGEHDNEDEGTTNSDKKKKNRKKHSKPKRERGSFPDPNVYFGDMGWLNSPLSPGLSRECAVLKLQGKVADWVGHILENHMMTLVVDQAGINIVSDLLSTIRAHRESAETISPLLGIAEHVAGQYLLPNVSDPLYKVSTVEVPGFASL